MDIAISTSPAATFMLRRKNVWYTMCDGNWNDPNVWISNALDRRLVTVPQPGDDVYINHTIDYPNTLTTAYLFNTTIGNLFISGTLTCNSVLPLNQCRLTVTGNVICSGTIDFSAAVNVMTLELRGTVNMIANFSAGANSTVQYNSPFSQDVAPVTYNNLEITNTNTKYIVGDLTVNGQLSLDTGASLELGAYNSTIATALLQGIVKKSSSTGVVNFNGNVTVSNSTGGVNFSGVSPTVNLSGNFGYGTGDLRSGSNFGNGTLNVLTNQTWTMNTSGNSPVSMGNPSVIIASGKALTIAFIGTNIGGWLLNGTGSVNGASGTSTLNINGRFAYGNSSTIMATGVFNYNNSGTSEIAVWTGVTMTLPFTSFYDLTIVGTATLSGNTTVSHTIMIPSGSLQLSTYDFSVTGLTTYAGAINKSGGGTVSFGAMTCQNSTGAVSFSSSPTVNLSGNISGDVRGGWNFGSGTVNITANMSFGVWTSGNVGPVISWNIVITSGKTLTNTGINVSSGGLTTSGTITGASSTAILDNRSVFTYNNATAPMATGKLYCNQLANNTFIYGASSNQDITTPSDATPGYQNLTLNGSGAKRLLGNVSVKATYTLTGPATLNSNGFALTNP
ncbi:MAG TPA: hypothetical protein VGN20_20595 [Mucilaginibacter sp.]|jgi:hypothetical protein